MNCTDSTAIFKRKRAFYRRKFPATNAKWWSLVNAARDQKQSTPDDIELANELNKGFYGVWSGHPT